MIDSTSISSFRRPIFNFRTVCQFVESIWSESTVRKWKMRNGRFTAESYFHFRNHPFRFLDGTRAVFHLNMFILVCVNPTYRIWFVRKMVVVFIFLFGEEAILWRLLCTIDIYKVQRCYMPFSLSTRKRGNR